MRKLVIKHLSDWHTRGNIEGMLTARQPSFYDEEADRPDLILVTGDMIIDPPGCPKQLPSANQLAEWTAFQRKIWLEQVTVLETVYPCVPIVAVPGNHDWCDYGVPDRVQSFDEAKGQTFQAAGVKITGFRGVPFIRGWWSYECDNRAFPFLIAELDPTADIVVTHSPPQRMLDEVPTMTHKAVKNVGIPGLAGWILQSQAQLNVFGHIHEQGGKTLVTQGKIFSNAATRMNELVIDVLT
jgi:Icc-related predicted phosphoesterase